MATVYIHIGAPKTATSTLQSILSQNRRKLLNNGVLYPREPGHGNAHHTLVADLIDRYQGIRMPDIWYGERPRGAAWDALRAEIESHEGSIHSVIVSSELFFGQNVNIGPILDEVASHLQGHEVRVVVYLRRQDQLYSSFYNQDVKGVRQWPDSAYEFYQTHQIFQQDYHSMLGAWSGVFGKKHVIIRPFEPEQWVNGDIVQDFCTAVGAISLPSGYRDHNESLGVVQLYVKRCLNRIGYDKGDNDEVLKVLAKVCPEKKKPASSCSYVHKGLYRKYREEWLQVNRAIAEDYLEGGELFLQPIPEPGEVELYKFRKVDLAGSIKLGFQTFDKGKYPGYRPLFARAMLLAMAEQDLWHCLEAADRERMLGWI